MKIIKQIVLVFAISSSAFGQEILYVNADNGLIIREKPNQQELVNSSILKKSLF